MQPGITCRSMSTSSHLRRGYLLRAVHLLTVVAVWTKQLLGIAGDGGSGRLQRSENRPRIMRRPRSAVLMMEPAKHQCLSRGNPPAAINAAGALKQPGFHALCEWAGFTRHRSGVTKISIVRESEKSIATSGSLHSGTAIRPPALDHLPRREPGPERRIQARSCLCPGR